MIDTIYYKQTKLLLQLLPLIYEEKDLALKGGTAINLFIRPMPRLSVDIDLTYLPVTERESALNDITQILNRIKERIDSLFPHSLIRERKLGGTDQSAGLIIQNKGIVVKVEVNTTFRGTVNPPVELALNKAAVDLFEMDVVVQSLAFEDLYAGKICAALDRQHPRDFYDIKILFENEGISKSLLQTFIVYLISHNRPIIELLNPNLKDFSDVYSKEFSGMTTKRTSIEELLLSRDKLIETIRASLTDAEIEFLITFKEKQPKWELLDIKGIEDLPSVKWKILNLNKMEEEKHSEAFNKLKRFLNSIK